jgi:hypothetical protein
MMAPRFARAGLVSRRALSAVAVLMALLAPALSPSPSRATVVPAMAGQPPAAAPAPALVASTARPAASVPKANGKAKVVTGPIWRELSPGQHQALNPLASTWDTLSEAQKRKWLALSANYPKMSPAEQEKLHSRMAEWVALSPQQRAAARLNFGETQKIAPDAKKAKWEGYQALPPEEKHKLAAGAARPPATAAAIKPVPPEKLATVPKPQPKPASKTPRIAAAPDQVNHNTLLPQQPPAASGGTH